jgi:alpha-tubulin suppressor-like RCC1 family protein
LVLLVACVLLIREMSQPKFPPPVVVSITQSNAPLRVSSGTGVFIILPDGSLWHWGQMGGPQFPRATMPERVGTNYDWAQVSAAGNHCVGVRKDGTLWEWGPGSMRFAAEPEQVGTNHDWVQVSSGGGHSVALKNDGTLWAWGNNSLGQLGNGPGPSPTNLVQVGDDRDWSAVNCQGTSTTGLRVDGTLWAWGVVSSFGNGRPVMHRVPAPIQICRETNWVQLQSGFGARAWTRSGEMWNLMERLPSAGETVAATGRLLISNSVPDKVAFAFGGTWSLYQVRSNGTLWEGSSPAAFWDGPPAGPWRQVGKRSDWISIWGSGATALGLTADGTVWTWGIDQGKEVVVDFAAKVKRFQIRVMAMFGKAPGGAGLFATQPYQKEPRPLMRLVHAPEDANSKQAQAPR